MRLSFFLIAALACGAALVSANAAQRDTAPSLTVEQARAIVAPLYEALNEPARKDVPALLAKAANPDYRSCSTNTDCLTRDQLAGVFTAIGKAIPDLRWTIVEIWTSGDRIVVRGEATGTPTGELFGVQPTGKSFTTISIDMFTVKNGKLATAYHVENWTTAMEQIRSPRQPEGGTSMSVDQIKRSLIGDWVSIAPELRPSAAKNPDGTLKAFYLKRSFKYLPGDAFQLSVVNSADPNGAVPLARIDIRGHVVWRGTHPVAAGAQKVDFIADEGYSVTPLIQGFADLLNQVASKGYAKWEVNQAQSVFGKSFAPFGLVEGRTFMEYDLIHLAHDMLFWGARNVDGRGFDKEENRPTNLQIPLVRK